MQALLQSFHVPCDHLAEVTAELDKAQRRFKENPHFGGLVCLAKPYGDRARVVIIVLWKASAIAEFAPEAEAAHRLIAATTDLGVTSEYYQVEGFVAGTTDLQSLLQNQ